MAKTTSLQNNLNLRKQQKKRKPWFVVKESHYRGGRVASRWRFPIGRHSGVRQEHKGKPPLVRIGYGSPAAVRSLHPSGKKPVLVHTEKDLLALDTERDGAVIAHAVGKKKKLSLLLLAQQKKIPVLHLKDIAQKIAALQGQLQARKQRKSERLQQKSKKQQEKEKKAVEKEESNRKEKEKEKEKSTEKVTEKETENKTSE